LPVVAAAASVAALSSAFGRPWASAHQVTQVADAHAGHFVHADQQRGADRQTVVADLADDRWRDFKHARQGSVVLQLHLAEQDVEQVVRIVAFL
jgi:hypothetical protein